MKDPKKILFDTYWTSKGWIEKADRRTDPADFAVAKKAGVMFDPVRVRHDDVIKNAREAAEKADPGRIARAFLASFSTRRVELRSALGSYAFARNLPKHRYEARDFQCAVCG